MAGLHITKIALPGEQLTERTTWVYVRDSCFLWLWMLPQSSNYPEGYYDFAVCSLMITDCYNILVDLMCFRTCFHEAWWCSEPHCLCPVSDVTAAVCCLLWVVMERTDCGRKMTHVQATPPAATIIKTFPLPLVCTAATWYINYSPSSLCHLPARGEKFS